MKRVLLAVLFLLPALAFAGQPADLDVNMDGMTKEQALGIIRAASLMQYIYLLSFKDNPDFIADGFDEAGQYHGWIETSETLRSFSRKACEHFGVKEGTEEAKPFFICMAVYSLGEEYAASKGQETDFSLDYKDYVSEFFGFTQYKHTKGASKK